MRLLRADIRDKVQPGWHAAQAQLNTFEHPGEELALLGEVRAVEASAGWLGLSVHGAVDA